MKNDKFRRLCGQALLAAEFEVSWPQSLFSVFYFQFVC